jgi:hypothetical protein
VYLLLRLRKVNLTGQKSSKDEIMHAACPHCLFPGDFTRIGWFPSKTTKSWVTAEFLRPLAHDWAGYKSMNIFEPEIKFPKSFKIFYDYWIL